MEGCQRTAVVCGETGMRMVVRLGWRVPFAAGPSRKPPLHCASDACLVSTPPHAQHHWTPTLWLVPSPAMGTPG
eukprot:364492-Chlamydomonas_euryale.AAC.4